MKKNPELYSKYANVKTPMGFSFDQAIQVLSWIFDPNPKEKLLPTHSIKWLILLTISPLFPQAGLDAPHLGVGIAAGEAASYEVYKDIMDIVIEGWHGYKPSDSHK